MPDHAFEAVDGFALDHVRGGTVVECRVGFSTLATVKLVAQLDLMANPELDHCDIRVAQLRGPHGMVTERGSLAVRIGREGVIPDDVGPRSA